MTHKEKANELYWKFRNGLPIISTNVSAEKCALIAVEEIIKISNGPSSFKYWQNVKKELEKL